jgi:hypothetical protein
MVCRVPEAAVRQAPLQRHLPAFEVAAAPPERARWPFVPLPDVLPLPLPWPRPMRRSALTAPLGGWSFERMSAITPPLPRERGG